jgi:AraC-like DNA-binding protein
VSQWRVSPDTETGSSRHVLEGGGGHALLLPVASAVFADLRVSASVSDGAVWWSLHSERNLGAFERAHNVETRRWAYNARMFAEASRSKHAVRGEHFGLSDLFVPVWMRDRPVGTLVVGPFSTARPSGPTILSRWRSLTGQHGHLADAEFAAYVRATLDTLVLERSELARLARIACDVAKLLGGDGPADAIASHADALRVKLARVRLPERMWEAAEAMVDERWSKLQFSAGSANDLSQLGLMHAADQIAVGLAGSRAGSDPVDDAVRRDALQRAVAHLAHAEGSAIAGKVGDRGVMLLFGGVGAAKARRKRAERLIDRAALLARRHFGMSLHFGASLAPGGLLCGRYHTALAAAEAALTQGRRLVVAEELGGPSPRSLRLLRERLARMAEERPELLASEFDRYLEAVGTDTFYRIEPARAQVEICFERLADTLLRGGGLDPKSLDGMCERLDRTARGAGTTRELFAAYRQAVTEMAAAVRRPVVAGQERGLSRALEYVHQHYRERIGVEKVARVAGFAPTYFSELFKKHEKVSFKKYLSRLRLERAEQLLTGTDLSVVRVAELSGHGSAQYLSRVFRRAHGVTPLAYRRGRLPEWFRKRRKDARTGVAFVHAETDGSAL